MVKKLGKDSPRGVAAAQMTRELLRCVDRLVAAVRDVDVGLADVERELANLRARRA